MPSSRPSALVMCGADPGSDPRPNRMIRALARDHTVDVISRGAVHLPGVTCHRIPPIPRKSFPKKLLGVLRMRLGQYQRIIWTPGLRDLAAQHRLKHYDFIAVHDLLQLPVALAIRSRGRLLFDAREYYPRHYEDRLWWRMMFQRLNVDLCRRFMPRADVVVTVSRGLATEFERQFGVTCRLMPSLPRPQAFAPRPVDPANIRMIHHGLASRSRQLEKMIEVMDHLPPHFSLDLMLMPSDAAYMEELRQRCATRPRVRLLPPVPFAELVATTHTYDIGLFLVPPISFNLRHTLPNKFFEFIQARLVVAIGPSPDMAAFVRAYDVGVVADDFNPATLAARLAALTPAEMLRFKQNAHTAAAALDSDVTDRMVATIARGEPAPALFP